MSHINIERSHSLGLEVIRKYALVWAEKAGEKLGVECKYEEGEGQDALKFSGSGIDGQLLVTPTTLKLEADLNFLTSMFKDKIEGKLTEQLDALLQAGAKK